MSQIQSIYKLTLSQAKISPLEKHSNRTLLSVGEKKISISFPNSVRKVEGAATTEKVADLYITNIEVEDSAGNLIWDLDFSELNFGDSFEDLKVFGGNCGGYWHSDDSYRFTTPTAA